MTPLGIQIMLHYYACTDDFRGGDFSAPAVGEAIASFTEMGLLVERPGLRIAKLMISERGQVYVNALMAVPLPERRWVMPSSHPGFTALNGAPQGGA